MKPAAAQKGFTLIEILVVLFIISIVSTVALLSISHNRSKQVETFANELNQFFTLASEEALLMPAVIGISYENHQFHFYHLESDSKKNVWVTYENKTLSDFSVPENIALDVKVANAKQDKEKGEDEDVEPQITISTNGDLTPFTIDVGISGQDPLYAVIGEADGNVITKSLS